MENPHLQIGMASHLPFMRRRENTSLSSADSVELKGAQVGRMALLLTFSLLAKEHHASGHSPILVRRDWHGGTKDGEPLPGVVALDGDDGGVAADDDGVAGGAGFVVEECAVDEGVGRDLGRKAVRNQQ